MNSEVIEGAQEDTDVTVDPAESSKISNSPLAYAAQTESADQDHETQTHNLSEQENAVEPIDILGFPELSLEFEENNQTFQTPEYMGYTTLSTPEVSFDLEGFGFEFPSQNKIDTEPDEEFEVDYNSSKDDSASEDDTEREYLTECSEYENEDESAAYEGNTEAGNVVMENEYSGENSEESVSQSEEYEEEESSQSESDDDNESTSEESEESQSEEEVDEDEDEDESAEEAEAESGTEVESQSEEESVTEDSESYESPSESDEDENNLANQDTEESEESELEFADDFQLNYENSEEIQPDNNESQESFEDSKYDEKIIPEYLKEVEVEESTADHTESIQTEELTKTASEEILVEESDELSSKDIDKQTHWELEDLTEDSCNEKTDNLLTELSAADIIRQIADLQNKWSGRVSDKKPDMIPDKGAVDGTENSLHSTLFLGNSDEVLSNAYPGIIVEGKCRTP